MTREQIAEILESVAGKTITPAAALEQLALLPFTCSGINIDFHRELRTLIPEAVYARDKSTEQIALIASEFIRRKSNLIITRLSAEKMENLKQDKNLINLQYDTDAGMAYCIFSPYPERKKKLGIVSAGTSDYKIVKEAGLTARLLGLQTAEFHDCGIAGLQRVLGILPELKDCFCIIAAAGMEGALPAVLSGLTGRLIIGVPSSAGYGAHFSGLAPLLAVINACAPTVVGVNIDNGFGAACAAASIAGAFS
ncbi:MAG TPA: nickel pincer cofactor biosynthesis protein LarB [Spirochaetia bacterium]|nr:nickel pincer cofactor biosynthesis protein LarB [Spirochaetia bacterium]